MGTTINRHGALSAGDDGRLGAGQPHQRRHLAMGSYFNPTEKLKGVRLDIAEYRRPYPKTAPRASKAAGFYMICTISKHAAEAKGYADAMMLDYRGQVTEATGANTFFIKDGVIHTPTPELLPERHHPPDGHRPRFTPSTISETLMNDDMKEVYPPAIAAG
ncbi:aminotransferase class IV [Rhizobium leguminosarum]|uniref:aminotransferase class IV n=1 Tax=Rhizobium leguminosarum TaxID=384 RepID=UPI0019EF090B|nr:hypothetical protein [Rhizobium leguminosarum bv. viciae]